MFGGSESTLAAGPLRLAEDSLCREDIPEMDRYGGSFVFAFDDEFGTMAGWVP
jgi:hypothetical protein